MATYDTSYYDKAYEEFEKKQKQAAQDQKTQTEADYNNRLKQAYISNMQTQKATNDALTNAGIRGGMTETSALKNSLAYQNTRNTLGAEKASAIREIDRNADNNIFNYKQTNDAAKNAYVEGREAEDREVARQTAAEQKAVTEQGYVAKYGGYYDIDELKATIETITDPVEKNIAMARLNYLTDEDRAKTEQNQPAYWAAKYSTVNSTSQLNTALKNATTLEEQTAILNRMAEVGDEKEKQKIDLNTAYYGKIYDIDFLNKELKKISDPVIRTIIHARIGAIRAGKKGY